MSYSSTEKALLEICNNNLTEYGRMKVILRELGNYTITFNELCVITKINPAVLVEIISKFLPLAKDDAGNFVTDYDILRESECYSVNIGLEGENE
jgi:hypothetical protein